MPNAGIDSAWVASMDIPQHRPLSKVRANDKESAFRGCGPHRRSALRPPHLRAHRWLSGVALAAHHLAAPGIRVLGRGGRGTKFAVSSDLTGRLGACPSGNESPADNRIHRPPRRGCPISVGPYRYRSGPRLHLSRSVVDRSGEKATPQLLARRPVIQLFGPGPRARTVAANREASDLNHKRFRKGDAVEWCSHGPTVTRITGAVATPGQLGGSRSHSAGV